MRLVAKNASDIQKVSNDDIENAVQEMVNFYSRARQPNVVWPSASQLTDALKYKQDNIVGAVSHDCLAQYFGRHRLICG